MVSVNHLRVHGHAGSACLLRSLSSHTSAQTNVFSFVGELSLLAAFSSPYLIRRLLVHYALCRRLDGRCGDSAGQRELERGFDADTSRAAAHRAQPVPLYLAGQGERRTMERVVSLSNAEWHILDASDGRLPFALCVQAHVLDGGICTYFTYPVRLRQFAGGFQRRAKLPFLLDRLWCARICSGFLDCISAAR